MGPAGLITLLGAGGGDTPLLVLISALLSGGTVTALLGYRRVRSGAQLDVLSAAKVIYDEQNRRNAELEAQARELRIQRDAALEGHRETIKQMAACNERIDELEVKVLARQETIEGLQELLAEARKG